MSVSAFALHVAAAVRAVAPEFNLPPTPIDAMVAAHAALESGWGRSSLSKPPHNNLFGVKAGASWSGPTVALSTTDYRADGTAYKNVARWRSYPSAEASIRDYLKLIMRGSRYVRSAALLRAGSLGYMAQLGRDGYYSASRIAHVSANWRSVLRRVLSVHGRPWISPSSSSGGAGALLAFGLAWWAVEVLT